MTDMTTTKKKPRAVRHKVSDVVLDAPIKLTVVNQGKSIICAYLNNHRIAGSKPWGGGDTLREWDLTLRDVVRAFPELYRAIGLDYLGNRVTPVKK